MQKTIELNLDNQEIPIIKITKQFTVFGLTFTDKMSILVPHDLQDIFLVIPDFMGNAYASPIILTDVYNKVNTTREKAIVIVLDMICTQNTNQTFFDFLKESGYDMQPYMANLYGTGNKTSEEIQPEIKDTNIDDLDLRLIRVMGGFKDTRKNEEDFALTPYLFGVYAPYKPSNSKVYGLGLCWGYYSIWIGIGINIPKKMKLFKIH